MIDTKHIPNPSNPNGATGPSSQAGKDIASRNSTRHGCCALSTLILPNEKIEDYYALQAAWTKAFGAQGELAQHLIDQLVDADWLYQRSSRTLAEIEAQINAAEPNPLNWTDQQHQTLTRFQRYRTANQNVFLKARKAIEDFGRNMNNQIDKETRLTIAKRRLKIYEEKNKPEPSIQDQIQELIRQKYEREAAAAAQAQQNELPPQA